MSYKAFISYSRKDVALARLLQSALHRFARPWYAFRAMRTFRDETVLGATAKLRARILQALDESEYLVLIASPNAVGSDWVELEMGHWLRTKRPMEKLLLVLAGGTLRWNQKANSIDRQATSSLPPVLLEALSEEPGYVDLSWVEPDRPPTLEDVPFRDAIATLAAGMHGPEVGKDDLIGEDLRQKRKLRRVGLGAAAVFAFLFVVAVVAAWLANRERIRANEQRDLAIARQLAADSSVELLRSGGLSQRALLLAVESLRSGVTSEGYAAYAAAMDRLARLERVIRTAAPATRVLLLGDGGRLATAVERDAMIWSRTTGNLLATCRHGAGIVELAASADGRFVLAAGGPMVTVCDAATGQVISRLPEPGDVTTIVLSGSQLAVGTKAGEVTLWSTADWRKSGALKVHAAVHAIAFAPASDDLAIASDAGGLIWRPVADRVEPLLTAKGNVAAPAAGASSSTTELLLALAQSALFATPATVTAAAYSPRMHYLAFGAADGSTTVIDLTSPSRTRKVFRARPRAVDQLLFTPDETAVIVRNLTATISIYDLGAAGPPRTIRTGGLASRIALSADGRKLLTASADGAVRLWNTATGEEIVRADGGGSPVLDMATDAATSSVVFVDGSRDVQIRRLEPTGAGAAFAPARFLGPIYGLSVSRDGRYVAASGNPFRVQVWRTKDSALHFDKLIPLEALLGVEFTSTSDGIAALVLQDVKLWYFGGQEAVFRHPAPVWGMAFDRSGKHLLTVANDGKIRSWSVAAQKTEYAQAAASVYAIAASRADDFFAVGALDVTLRRVVDGMVVRRFPMPAQVTALAFAPDGRRLAAGTLAGAVIVLDLRSGEVLWSRRHGDEIRSVAFSADGRRLVSASGSLTSMMRAQKDDSARTWDVATGTQMFAVEQPVGVAGAAFAPDGGLLVARMRDVGRWETDFPNLARRACATLTRPLSPAEWSQYMPNRPNSPTCGGPTVE